MVRSRHFSPDPHRNQPDDGDDRQRTRRSRATAANEGVHGTDNRRRHTSQTDYGIEHDVPPTRRCARTQTSAWLRRREPPQPPRHNRQRKEPHTGQCHDDSAADDPYGEPASKFDGAYRDRGGVQDSSGTVERPATHPAE